MIIGGIHFDCDWLPFSFPHFLFSMLSFLPFLRGGSDSGMTVRAKVMEDYQEKTLRETGDRRPIPQSGLVNNNYLCTNICFFFCLFVFHVSFKFFVSVSFVASFLLF